MSKNGDKVERGFIFESDLTNSKVSGKYIGTATDGKLTIEFKKCPPNLEELATALFEHMEYLMDDAIDSQLEYESRCTEEELKNPTSHYVIDYDDEDAAFIEDINNDDDTCESYILDKDKTQLNKIKSKKKSLKNKLDHLNTLKSNDKIKKAKKKLKKEIAKLKDEKRKLKDTIKNKNNDKVEDPSFNMLNNIFDIHKNMDDTLKNMSDLFNTVFGEAFDNTMEGDFAELKKLEEVRKKNINKQNQKSKKKNKKNKDKVEEKTEIAPPNAVAVPDDEDE